MDHRGEGRSEGRAAGTLAAVGGVIAIGLCCGGPLVILALASVGVGALVGGLGGAFILVAALGLLLLRRTRRARRLSRMGAAADCCTPLASEPPTLARAGRP